MLHWNWSSAHIQSISSDPSSQSASPLQIQEYSMQWDSFVGLVKLLMILLRQLQEKPRELHSEPWQYPKHIFELLSNNITTNNILRNCVDKHKKISLHKVTETNLKLYLRRIEFLWMALIFLKRKASGMFVFDITKKAFFFSLFCLYDILKLSTSKFCNYFVKFNNNENVTLQAISGDFAALSNFYRNLLSFKMVTQLR